MSNPTLASVRDLLAAMGPNDTVASEPVAQRDRSPIDVMVAQIVAVQRQLDVVLLLLETFQTSPSPRSVSPQVEHPEPEHSHRPPVFGDTRSSAL